MDAHEEADLSAVFVAYSSEVGLVEEGFANCSGRVRCNIVPCGVDVEFFGKDVGAEVSDLFGVAVCGEHSDKAEGMPHHLDVFRQHKHYPRGVSRFAPAIAFAVDSPRPFHFEVGVEDLFTELHEEVFSVGPYAVDGLTGEIVKCH